MKGPRPQKIRQAKPARVPKERISSFPSKPKHTAMPHKMNFGQGAHVFATHTAAHNTGAGKIKKFTNDPSSR